MCLKFIHQNQSNSKENHVHQKHRFEQNDKRHERKRMVIEMAVFSLKKHVINA